MPSDATQNIKVAIYTRVSTEEQKEGQTIDSQIAELRRFAAEKGWIVVDVYKDEGWSGSLLARPELDRLRDDAARGRFTALLVNDVDRLSRDVSHLGIIKRDLERCGVQIVFRKLPAEQSPTYNLMVNILGSFAEFERELIADRMRRGRRHKVEFRQQFIGARPAYGYRYVRKDHKAGKEGYLEVASEEALVVRQMYEWVDQEGLSARKVVERLNETGAVPQKNGDQWQLSSVRRILRSEMYAGVWYYNKHESCEPLRPIKKEAYKHSLKSSRRLRPREEWLPIILPACLRIIERDLWQRVQTQLTRNRTFSPRNTKHIYLLRGLVRCGACNASVIGDPNHGRFYYRCRARCKRLPTIRENYLNDAVWGAVEEAILNPSLLMRHVKIVRQNQSFIAQKLSGESHEIEQALEQVQKEEERLLEAYRTAVITAPQLRQELEKIKARRGALENRKTRISDDAKVINLPAVKQSVSEYCHRAAGRLKTFTGTERQRFLQFLVEEIIYESGKVTIRGVIPIEGTGERKASQESLYVSQSSAAPRYRVTSTKIDCEARKPVLPHDRTASTKVYLYGRNSTTPPYLTFELINQLPEKPFSIMNKEGMALLQKLMREYPTATLQQLCEKFLSTHNVRVAVSSMSRARERLRNGKRAA